jgi:WD40 repeat protein
MAEFDMQTNKITARQKFGFKAVLCSRFDYHPAVFDANGAMYIIESIDKVRKRKIPVQGAVTAFASSKNEKMEAYGMSDGTIFLVDSMGKTRRLVGHRSRISKLKINGKRIFSSSFDGTLNLWVASNQKIEPMTMLNAGNWIMNFTFDPSKQHIWAGCQKGNIVETLISLETIVKDVRRKLKRDFTREEWNYYIGENVPYESLINTKM